MPIVAAIAVPHPPLILPEIGKGDQKVIQKTIDAFEKAARFVADQAPETVVIISPHSTLFMDWIEISPGKIAEGSFARFGVSELDFLVEYDQPLAKEIGRLALESEVAAGPSGRGDKSLDHGTMIPLAFLQPLLPDMKVVRIGLSGLSMEEHFTLGRCIGKAAGEKRVAVVASGDLSHKLLKEGPYGFVHEGPQLDALITGALETGDFKALMEIDPLLADQGAECGLRSFVIMGGALEGTHPVPELLSYEGPFGVGYAVATFAPQPEESGKLADRGEKDEKSDPYVALARYSLSQFVKTGTEAILPPGLPDEMLERRAGAFVSLHKNGDLRGCIGTIGPTTANVALEILQNAVSAAVHDPRFSPVGLDELDDLEINVDVLGDPEPIESMSQLDPVKYGVIVSHQGRRGLLLPDLDGVDTAEMQVDIARQKAGIPAGIPLKMERFEVIRHHDQ